MGKVTAISRIRSISCRACTGALAGALFAASLGADPEITPAPLRNPGAVTQEVPVQEASGHRALKLDYSALPVALRIVLPPPSAQEKQAATRRAEKGPAMIGYHRDVPGGFEGDLSPQLDWVELPDGAFVSSLSVTSPGAKSLRIGIRAELGPEGEIRFFGEQSDERFPVIAQEDFHIEGDKIQTLWSPSVDGDTIGVEITLPSEKAMEAFSFSIDAVAHTLVPIGALPVAPKLDCPRLHIDVACRADSIGRLVRDAVARIRYEDDGTFVCSGTLLNDTVEATGIPYFLTASHCVDSGIVARTVETYWYFQAARCGAGSIDSRAARSTGGADLLAANRAYDLSLLRIRGRLPAGLTMSGWSTESIDHPARVYGVHHPNGERKRYSAGSTRFNRDSDRVSNAIAVTWSEGTTEGGSSGSGLFLRSGDYLVGGLSHGPNCGPRITDRYGPFRDFYPQIARWLDPGDSLTPVADDHGDTPADATPVRNPSSTAGNLERPGDRDFFRFQLATTHDLRVYTRGSTDTYGTLTRSSGSFRRVDDDSGEATNFQIRVSGASAGTYYIEVRGYNSTATGTYTLHVASTADPGGRGPRLEDAGSHLGDFNGDGRDDVLLRHSDGRWFYYPMNGRRVITSQRGPANLTSNTAWRFAGIGDMNGDGRDDVLMRHTNGRWYYYAMNGRRVIPGRSGTAHLTSNTAWRFAGIGDLNGDGREDVLLRHSDGRWFYYPMNGRRVIASQRGPANLTSNTAWRSAGIGDMNGDGRDDVLMRHTNGRWYYYAMNGRRVIPGRSGTAHLTSNTAWRFAGIGDLNGDGREDVLLRHSDGRWFYYPMNGRRVIASQRGPANLTSNTAWMIKGIGDLNGDRRSDVLLRHGEGRWYYYAMNGRNRILHLAGSATLTTNRAWSVPAETTSVGGNSRAAPMPAPDHAPGVMADEAFLLLGASAPDLPPDSFAHFDAATAENVELTTIVPFFASASNPPGRGHLRIINHSEADGEVRILGVDDSGTRNGPITLSLKAKESVHLNSRDLENGNPDKGLPAGLGDGSGDWRLEVSGEVDFETLAFIRADDGLLSPVHEAGLSTHDGEGGVVHRVPFFHSAGERGIQSRLRLVNLGEESATLTITGRDDAGEDGEGDVRLTIPSGAARTVAAQELESGNFEPGPGEASGGLGDGTGEWQLSLSADGDIAVMNILRGRDGRFADLSAHLPLADSSHAIPFFAAASNPLLQGQLRIVNRSDEDEEVRISGIDDSGTRSGPITLSLAAKESVHLDSRDLEDGNPSRGLPAGLGDGSGDWRLHLSGDSDFEPFAFVRSADAFLSPVHALGATKLDAGGNVVHRVPFFHSAGERGIQSRLRLVNLGEESATLTITGRDDAGRDAEGDVRVTLPPGGARTVTAQELESGNFESGPGEASGRLGDGTGGWQLSLSADGDVALVNVLRSSDGHFSDLSASTALRRSPSGRRIPPIDGCERASVGIPGAGVVPCGRPTPPLAGS